MKRIIPILGVVVLIVLLVLVNHGINKSAHPDTDDDDASSSQQTTPPKPAAPVKPVAGSTDDLPAEITVGDPAKSKYKIAVGWAYDDVNQVSPQALGDALKAVQTVARNSGGTASAEVINLDMPTADLSPLASGVTGLGVSVNGRMMITANPGEQGVTADLLTRALQQRLASPP